MPWKLSVLLPNLYAIIPVTLLGNNSIQSSNECKVLSTKVTSLFVNCIYNFAFAFQESIRKREKEKAGDFSISNEILILTQPND